MTDRNVQFPNRYQLSKVEGTDDIYDLIPAPGTVTDEGTLINKDTLLQDATAAMYGLGTDAVPDDVFSILKTLLDNNTELANEKAQAVYGSYVGTGGYNVNSPTVLTFNFEPKIVFIIDPTTPNDFRQSRALIRGAKYGTSEDPDGGTNHQTTHLTLNWSGNTLSFYGNTVNGQLNTGGLTYLYVAIG